MLLNTHIRCCGPKSMMFPFYVISAKKVTVSQRAILQEGGMYPVRTLVSTTVPWCCVFVVTGKMPSLCSRASSAHSARSACCSRGRCGHVRGMEALSCLSMARVGNSLTGLVFSKHAPICFID